MGFTSNWQPFLLNHLIKIGLIGQIYTHIYRWLHIYAIQYSYRVIWRKKVAMEIDSQRKMICHPLVFIPQTDNNITVLNETTKKLAEIEQHHAQILQCMKKVVDINQLQHELLKQGWDNFGLKQLPGILNDLYDNELFYFVDELVKNITPEEHNAIDSYCILTKDRPESLKRLDNQLRQLNQPVQLIISDQSCDSIYKQNAAISGLQSNAKNEHFGKKEIEALIDKAPHHLRESVSFAVLPSNDDYFKSYGANRNLILLNTIGKKICMCDDDVELEPICFNNRMDTVKINSSIDPFSYSSSPIAYTKALPQEMFTTPIGAPIHSLFSKIDCSNIDNGTDSFFSNLSNPDSRIAAVSFGYYGNLGSTSNLFYLTGRKDSNLLSEDEFNKSFDLPESYKFVSEPQIGPKILMSAYIHYDNTRLLPPFSPFQRNEDALWGYSLNALQPLDFIYYSPLMMKHSPVEKRNITQDFTKAINLSLNDMLRIISLHFNQGLESKSNRYKCIGEHIIALAESESFKLKIVEFTIRYIQTRKYSTEQLLNQYDYQPEWWANHLERILEACDMYLDRENMWLPIDVKNDPAFFQKYIRSYGKLLTQWEEVYSFYAQQHS